MPEKKYQHRSVVEKLGIQMGQAVAFAHEAGEIDADLAQEIVAHTGRLQGGEDEVLDMVLAVVDETSDVVEVLARWRGRIKSNGGIWLLTAKRGQVGYVDQRELIMAGQEAGVVDNKVCSVSERVSAMRFVIRKKDRID